MVEFINMKLDKNDLIYDDKVRMTRKGDGIVRFKEGMELKDVFVIFPIMRKNKGGSICIAVDQILHRPVIKRDDEICICLGKEFVGKKCIIIPYGLKIMLNRNEIISDNEVKQTYSGQGIVFLPDSYLGNRSYVIFPKTATEAEEGNEMMIDVDEILNKGIHPNNNHTSRVLLSRKHIGKKAILILQEG